MIIQPAYKLTLLIIMVSGLFGLCWAEQPTKPVIKTKEQLLNSLAPTAKPLTRSFASGGKTRSIAVVAPLEIDTQAILFKFGTAEIDGTTSWLQIQQIAEAIKDPRLAGASFEIRGHTCDVGSDEANKALSEKRAKTVVEALVGLTNIPPERLRASGAGETEPKAVGTSEETRAQNRRVQIVRLP